MDWPSLLSGSELSPMMPVVAAVQLNVFDAFVVGMLGWGIYAGKENGASGLWMDFIQWAIIALAGGLMGGLIGSAFRALFSAGPYWSQTLGYITWVLIICGFFAFLASKGKDEAIDGDKFGKLEYPLGILGGMLKKFFIVLVVMSFLNARIYTPAQLEASRQMQIKEFGSTLFPTITSMHFTVFKNSFCGPFLDKAFGWAVLQPVKPVPIRR